MSEVCVYAFARASGALRVRAGVERGQVAGGGDTRRSKLGLGTQRERLQLIVHGRIAAVVGEVKSRLEPDEAVLRAHDAVVRRLHLSLDGVLPVRFGTCSPRSGVLAMMERREAALQDALAQVRGADQMVLRIFGKPLPHANVSAEGPGARYLQARFQEHVATRSAPELAPLKTPLEKLIRAERVRRTETLEDAVATVYHLVPRGKVERYQRLLALAPEQLGVRVVVSGPHAPYAFGPEAGA